MIGNNTVTAVAINWIKRWPAVRLAVSRTPSANGRMNRLIVSIIIKTGIRSVGVPSGRRCPRASVGWFRIPIITVANQRGNARPIFNDSCVVGVKVYGRRPNIFNEIKSTIREVSNTAHLCPGIFTGMKSSYANRPINQFCNVRTRLFNHRVVGAGKRSQGKVRANPIKGTPRNTGLINWSKKLNVMVSFKIPL